MNKKGFRERFSGKWAGLVACVSLALAPVNLFIFLLFVCPFLPGHCIDDTPSFGIGLLAIFLSLAFLFLSFLSSIASVLLREKGLHGRTALFISTLVVFSLIGSLLAQPFSHLILRDLESLSQEGKCSNSLYWTVDVYRGFGFDENKQDWMEYFVSGGRPLVGLSANSEGLWSQRGRDFSEISDLNCIEFLAFQGNASSYGELPKLKNLKVLRMSPSDFSDSSLLNGLKKIEFLDLSNTPISDISFASSMPNLRYLYINNTGVSDISPLEGLENLEIVELQKTKVSDLSPLKGMKHLRTVAVHGSLVSGEHCAKIATTTPNRGAFLCPE